MRADNGDFVLLKLGQLPAPCCDVTQDQLLAVDIAANMSEEAACDLSLDISDISDVFGDRDDRGVNVNVMWSAVRQGPFNGLALFFSGCLRAIYELQTSRHHFKPKLPNCTLISPLKKRSQTLLV